MQLLPFQQLLPVLPLLALAALPAGETELSKQSRSFFEKLIDLKLEQNLLVIKATNGFPDASSLRESAAAAFPQVARISVQSSRGSTSTHRGGAGGEVSIQIGAEGDAQGFSFRITTPGGDSVTVEQRSGSLTLEFRSGKSLVRYEQEKGKCKLQVKAGAESFSAVRRSLPELAQAEPVGVRKHFFSTLELYLDKAPFVAFSAAPPGKTIVRLRDGAEIFGELQAKEIKVVTAYGPLTIPRSELIQIIFPGSELEATSAGEEGAKPQAGSAADSVVVSKRFSPRGQLGATRFKVTTAYGDLEVDAADIVEIAFGPPLEPAGPVR